MNIDCCFYVEITTRQLFRWSFRLFFFSLSLSVDVFVVQTHICRIHDKYIVGASSWMVFFLSVIFLLIRILYLCMCIMSVRFLFPVKHPNAEQTAIEMKNWFGVRHKDTNIPQNIMKTKRNGPQTKWTEMKKSSMERNVLWDLVILWQFHHILLAFFLFLIVAEKPKSEKKRPKDARARQHFLFSLNRIVLFPVCCPIPLHNIRFNIISKCFASAKPLKAFLPFRLSIWFVVFHCYFLSFRLILSLGSLCLSLDLCSIYFVPYSVLLQTPLHHNDDNGFSFFPFSFVGRPFFIINILIFISVSHATYKELTLWNKMKKACFHPVRTFFILLTSCSIIFRTVFFLVYGNFYRYSLDKYK